jgi:putative ATP-dependent endonuclease of OLD family
MKLVYFSVTNYRSITAAYKLPIRQSTILIGPNNEGKSNILRALVTALEVLRNLGRFKIMRGRFQSHYYLRDTYAWAKDFPVTLQEKTPGGESVFNLEFELTETEIEQFEEEVKSTLNGTLPVQLSLGQKEPGFRVLKKGPGAAALSSKDEAIAQFIAKRININYIPAVRTADSAERIVSEIVEKELAAVEDDENLKKRWQKSQKSKLQFWIKSQKVLKKHCANFCRMLKPFTSLFHRKSDTERFGAPVKSLLTTEPQRN